MTGGLLPGADRDLVNILAKRIETMCEAVLLEHARSSAMKDAEDGIARDASRAKGSATAARADVRSRAGVGRPAAELGACPVSTRRRSRSNERGFIEVDEQRRTAEPTIFAIGDVAGEPMLAHKASHEGRVAVEAIAGEQGRRSSRWRSRPSSSPIRRSRGAA